MAVLLFVVVDIDVVPVLWYLLCVIVRGSCSCSLHKFLFFVIDTALVRRYCTLCLIVL